MPKKLTAQEAQQYAEKYAEDDVTVTVRDADTIVLTDGVAYKIIDISSIGKLDLRAEVKEFTNCD